MIATRLDLIRCASSETNKMYKISDKDWLYKSKKTLEISKGFIKDLTNLKGFIKDFTNLKGFIKDFTNLKKKWKINKL